MKRPLAVAVLTFAVVASTPLAPAAPNGTSARLHQEPAAAQPAAYPAASENPGVSGRRRRGQRRPVERPGLGAARAATARPSGGFTRTASGGVTARTSGVWTATTMAGPANSKVRLAL